MNNIIRLYETSNSIDYILNNLTKDQIKFLLKEYIKIKTNHKRKVKKYHTSEKGKKKVNEASKRYYYKVKCNNKYHAIYNPLGKKKT